MSNLSMERVHVTPPLASEWLATNGPNRKLRAGRVARYARDMANGEWRETHQAIGFNSDGTLRDGQHRLSAVVKSECAQWFWVARGLTEDAVLMIDTHASRKDADAYQVAGRMIGSREVAVAKQMYVGPRALYTQGLLSRQGLLDFIDEHETAITFACNYVTQRGVGNASIHSAIARAWYHVEVGCLERFRSVFLKGPSDDFEPRDKAALKLREYALSVAGAGGGGHIRLELYRRTQTAVSAFAENRSIANLRSTVRDLYPLPAR